MTPPDQEVPQRIRDLPLSQANCVNAVATTERWVEFNEEWQAELDREPSLDAFKMKHAMTGSDVWHDWREDARAVRLDQFHAVIMRHAMVGFGCVVYLDAFKELIQRDVRYSNAIYQIAFLGLVANTLRYHRQMELTDKMDFVFDEQMHEFPKAIQAFCDLWTKEPYLRKCMAGTPRSAVDDKVLPLQAADYLAWQIRRQFASLETPSSSARQLAITLEHQGDPTDIPIMVDVWDRARLEGLRDEVLNERQEAISTMDLPEDMRRRLKQSLTVTR